ncbi:MAG TPA: hypothetical protein VIG90_08085 [Pedomonas sp.]|uniref:hypothetical protein n=1 Tax=Pedomonas sp. TaxID=2976421 RepID=UPI002F40F14D
MQKLAVRLSSQPVRPLLERMDPGGWVYDTAAFPSGEIGVIHAPVTHGQGDRTALMQRTNTGPGLIRLENGDIIAWSGLPLAEGQKVKLTAARDLPKLAPELDGVFAAIGWSASEGRLYVITDFLGLQPVYVGDDGQGGWMAANETKVFPYTPDAASWGAFIAFGQSIGRSTATQHAERLRPATVLAITPGLPGVEGANRQIETSRYWETPDEGSEPPTRAIVELLKDNTAAYHGLVDDSVFLLSGGFDSRAIFAALHELGVKEKKALILSHYEEDADLDGKLAALVARRTNTPIDYRQPDRDFFSSTAYLDYIDAIDGGTPNLYMFIAQLSSVIQHCGAVWEGLIPPLALRAPLQTGDGSFETFHKTMFKTGGEAVKIFKPSVRTAFRDAFEAEFERTKTFYPNQPHGVWQWVVENRMRNRTGVNPTKVYINHVTPLMVGASRPFWKLAATIPFNRRRDYHYYVDVFRTLTPELTRIPFSSGSVLHRGDAPWLTFKRYKAIQDIWRAVQRRPRLAKLLGLDQEMYFTPSRYVGHAALYREEDDLLDMDVVRRAETDDALREQVGKLLFHWRTTRWVHENRLHETLEAA